MVKMIDDLAEFEEFRANTLKAIRTDIRKGLSAADIRKKYASIVQGRLITDALTTEDVGRAAALGKDILDRVEGKAKEQTEVTHRMAKLNDKELDALLKSEDQELAQMEERFQDEH
jgi:hypothetical protein